MKRSDIASKKNGKEKKLDIWETWNILDKI